ncbi:tsr0935 [Thermosynechococcus vestitus BP-1]|uniref:Tsr0935 protein n=1 Tax=Thermosynechococcus vestitus (strain NIES-2133 / IAM M-273 / BP-1) TaxID=197221 RepID=Q8DKC4_THEVB|nr:tsr0935 [Thermosynechococcus vestitus BP-1]
MPTIAEIDGIIVTDPPTLKTQTSVTAQNHSSKTGRTHFGERWQAPQVQIASNRWFSSCTPRATMGRSLFAGC